MQLSHRYYLIAFCAIFAFVIFAISTVALSRPGAAEAQAATAFTLKFTCAQAVDYQAGKVCVHTQPRATLTIKVMYCSGYYATSRSLKGTRSANWAGNYTWYWQPETKCHGPATAYVTASWHRQTITKIDTFTVK